MKGELRKGLSKTVPFLLSHHTPARRDRCHRIALFGRHVHLCARCSGIYPGILAGLLVPLYPTTLPLIAVLPLPALVDWAITSFRPRHGSNAVRTVTGLLLGYGYGSGLLRVLVGRDLSVLAIGAAYGLVAAALLYAQRIDPRFTPPPTVEPSSRMAYCINCGERVDDAAAVCPDCGVNQDTQLDGAHEDRGADEKYCVNCGELIYKQSEMCPECGVSQPTGGSDDSANSEQVAAGILAILLGGLGVHKFYQGNTRNGVLYLCFFWTAIPALLGLIEGILMLLADEAEYEEKWADGSILGR